MEIRASEARARHTTDADENQVGRNLAIHAQLRDQPQEKLHPKLDSKLDSKPVPEAESTEDKPIHLDFGASPYVKDGVLQSLSFLDYIDGCIKPPQTKPEGHHLAPPKPVEIEQSYENFNLLKNIVPFDPNRHTVVILDDFQRSEYSPNGSKQPGLSHGEVSAAAAEQAGFNVLRLDINRNAEMATILAEVDKLKNEGRLPLRSGDALNISYERNWTWSEARCLLHMSVTPKSYASQRQEIMQRVNLIATGKAPVKAPADGVWLTEAAGIHKQIENLQNQGLTVVAAAGNQTRNQLNLDFINAREQLAAGNAKGKTYPFSAQNSLTTTYPGGFEMVYEPSKKAYHLRNTNVYFPERDFGGAPESVAHRRCQLLDARGNTQSQLIDGNVDFQSCPVAVISGTSFANVQFWPDYRKRLEMQERQGNK
jgi:hypothetical protein